MDRATEEYFDRLNRDYAEARRENEALLLDRNELLAHYQRATAEALALRDRIAQLGEKIADLERICSESYQVVGALAAASGTGAAKALDNLSQRRLVHEDVLPFMAPERIAELERDKARFEWWFGFSFGPDFVAVYMEGILKGWNIDQWRAAIDAAMKGGK